MKSLVQVPLPINIDNHSFPFFNPYTSYRISPFKVKYIKKVFVTHSGLVINKNGLMKECHHDDPDHYPIFLNEASFYYYDLQDHPENLLILDDDQMYLSIHHPWFNYYHWICESILRLWLVKDQINKMILILPDYYKESDFIMNSLKPFNFKGIFFIPSNKTLWVYNLCLPQIKPICDSYHADKLREIRTFYLDYINLCNIPSFNLGDKIYLSRKKASRKRVCNEVAIEELVKKYGFTVVCNEDFSFFDQIAIYSEAKYLISIHGSGLTNMLFMKDQASVLEILKTKTNVLTRPSFVFWYQAAALNFNYYQQLVEFAIDDDYFTGDFTIDLKLLEINLKLMLKL